MSATVAELTSLTGMDIVTDYAAELEVPVLSGVQRQGDVLVLPSNVTASVPVPAVGTAVVRGESGGNTHAVYADAGSGVLCDAVPASAASLRVAMLAVPEGATAWLGHPEHGYIGIAPGSYEIRRQREQADELRMVAD